MLKCIGFDCWHDYSTNPKTIDILLSTDGENFITWTTLHAELVNLFIYNKIAGV